MSIGSSLGIQPDYAKEYSFLTLAMPMVVTHETGWLVLSYETLCGSRVF